MMIANGALSPGEPLSEMALADHLGVSKTPVREAFLRLKQEGLVETAPRRGTYVFEMDADQVGQLSRFRLVLERSALDVLTQAGCTRLAAEHRKLLDAMGRAIAQGDGPRYRMLDTNYHLALVKASGNAFLTEAYSTIAWRIQVLLGRLLKDPNLNDVSFAEHRRLTEEIAGGRVAEAAQLLDVHIRDFERRCLRMVTDADDPS